MLILKDSSSFNLYFLSVFTGTEKFIDNLLNLMDHEPSFLLGSVSILDGSDHLFP